MDNASNKGLKDLFAADLLKGLFSIDKEVFQIVIHWVAAIFIFIIYTGNNCI